MHRLNAGNQPSGSSVWHSVPGEACLARSHSSLYAFNRCVKMEEIFYSFPMHCATRYCGWLFPNLLLGAIFLTFICGFDVVVVVDGLTVWFSGHWTVASYFSVGGGKLWIWDRRDTAGSRRLLSLDHGIMGTWEGANHSRMLLWEQDLLGHQWGRVVAVNFYSPGSLMASGWPLSVCEMGLDGPFMVWWSSDVLIRHD